MNKKYLYMIVIFVIGFLLFPNNVFAKEKLEIKEINVVNHSDNINVDSLDFNNSKISTKLLFDQLNDFITLEVLINNNSDNEYKLLNIKNNFDGDYIFINSPEIGSTLKENESKKINITLKYNKELQNQEELKINNGSIEFVFEDHSALVNPKTGIRLIFIIIMVLFLIGISYYTSKKRVTSLILLLLLSIPTIVYAKNIINLKLEFSDITVKGRFLNYDVVIENGESTLDSFQVAYGEPIGELPILDDRTGYNTIGWINQNGESVSSSTIVTKNLTITPKYMPIEYNLYYVLNGGTLTNPNPQKYTIEDSIVLNNPTKSGYTFIGWNEAGSNNVIENMTILKGTIGDKTFVANFMSINRTTYVVIHRQMDLTGNSYVEYERETLNADKGSSITPSTKTYKGFTSPTVQTKTIAADGSTVFTYDYTRNKYTLSCTICSPGGGTYYYGTSIKVSAVSSYKHYDNTCYLDYIKKCIGDNCSYSTNNSSFPLEADTNLYSHYRCTCLSGETEVEVYDKKKKKRRKKKLKDVTYDDLILCWDFDKGEFAWAKPLWIMNIEKSNTYLELTFSDGTILQVVADHRIYNDDMKKFTSCKNNKETPIGMHTINANGEIITLVKKKYKRGCVDVCNVITNYYINLYGNGILTSRGLSNLYPIENMKYVKDNRKVFSREELNEIPDEYFDGLRIGETPRNFMGDEENTIKSLMQFINRTINTKKK